MRIYFKLKIENLKEEHCHKFTQNGNTLFFCEYLDETVRRSIYFEMRFQTVCTAILEKNLFKP